MEYVKLDPSEQTYSKKNLLYSEMEILRITKRYEEFVKLRKLELNLKSSLRKKIKEVKEDIEILNSFLPTVKKKNYELANAKKNYPKPRKDLESEIAEIQQKLAELQ